MGARLRSWWQFIKTHRITIQFIAIFLAIVFILILIGYLFEWTGFNGYNQMTIAHTISGTNAGTVVRTEVSQPRKTLWDWMQLLFIPVVLAVAGFWFNYRERKAAEKRAESEREIEQQRAQTESDIAEDNQREAALQAYLDKMSELLLEKHLRESDPDTEVRKIARVRTLTVLSRLDPIRKRSVLQFLYESDLIDKNKRTIYLNGADLSDANLNEFDLHEADLRRVNLKGANLDWANLSGSNLSKADLSKATLIVANLSGADLSGTNLCESNLSEAYLNDTELSIANLENANLDQANLGKANLSGAEVTTEQLKQAKSLQGATMPDGSIHP